MTIGQIFWALKPAQFWSIIVAIFAAISVIATLAYKFGVGSRLIP
jgi:hypothetical protein